MWFVDVDNVRSLRLYEQHSDQREGSREGCEKMQPEMSLPVSRTGQMVLALAMMTGLWVTIVSLHVSGNSSAAITHRALLQEDYQRQLAYRAGLRQMRLVNVAGYMYIYS